MIEPYYVPDTHSWDAVSADLIKRALEDPLDHPDSDNYSASEEEALAKAQTASAARVQALVKHSALVVYNRRQFFSITLTKEPGPCMHLSMTELVAPGKMNRMSDADVRMVADAIIGEPYDERTEGVLSGVRHFYSCR